MSHFQTEETRAELLPESGQWQVRLFGDFQLLNHLGLAVGLRTRKQEGLIAVLALNRSLGIEREEAAEILWPDSSPDKRRASLRQALLDIRVTLGPDAIQSSRSHLRLSSGFPLFLEASPDSFAEFMPGHEGPWFEEKRRHGPVAEMPEMPQQIIGHFHETLKWYSGNEPRGLYSLLRASPQMVRGIGHADVLKLVASAPPDPALVGWASYWRGTAEEDLQVCSRLLKIALDHARISQDYELASLVCLEIGKVFLRTGQVTEARKVAQFADDIATKTGTVQARVDAARLRGTLEMHLLNPQAGMAALARAQDSVDSQIEWFNLQALQAYFAACNDRYDLATALFSAPAQFADRTGHVTTSVLCEMTQAILGLASGRPIDVVPKLIEYSARCYVHGSTQFGVYADELLARVFTRIGDRGMASERSLAARLGRSASQMAVTPLEAKGLASLT